MPGTLSRGSTPCPGQPCWGRGAAPAQLLPPSLSCLCQHLPFISLCECLPVSRPHPAPPAPSWGWCHGAPGPLLRPQLRSSPSRDPAMCQTPRGPPCRAGWSGSPLRVPVSGRVSENRADPQLAVCSVIRFPPPRNECALPHHCIRVSKEPIFPPCKLGCVRRGY